MNTEIELAGGMPSSRGNFSINDPGAQSASALFRDGVSSSSAHRRAERVYDVEDLSSTAFWSQTGVEREQTFARLRASRPVSWHRPVQHRLFEDLNDQGFWAVTSHAGVIEVTKRHEDFLSGEGVVMESMPPELLDAVEGFIAMDPPRHTKIRRLLTAAFTPKQIRRIDHQIKANATRIVDDLAPMGNADFVTECAALMPMHSICDMMGIAEHQRRRVADESRYAGGWSDPELMGNRLVVPRLFVAAVRLREIAADLIAQRRAHPGGDDLMTSLVEAEIDGEKLTDDEILSFFGLLTVAGNDTTRQSTSHTMKALTDHPEQRRWLMADYDNRIKTSVEEMVRWATPIMTFRRTAAHDTILNGHHITQGDKIVMFYSSANFDTDVFSHPDQFQLDRTPNPHLAFGGGGIHHCLGNQLARQQLTHLFKELLTRLPDIRVNGEPTYTLSTFFHGVNHLPVTFTPRGRTS